MRRLREYLIPGKFNQYKPYFLREKITLVIAVLVLFLVAFSFFTTTIVRNTSLLTAVYPSVLVDLANQNRIANNQNTLSVNPILEEAARLKAEDMAKKGYFSHQSPDGKTPWSWIQEAGYSFVYAGENLAVDFSESADVNQAWLNSPGHRANILGANFTEIGVAVSKGEYHGRPTIFVVQMFGSPAKIIPEEIPVPVPPVLIASQVPSVEKIYTPPQEIVVLGEQKNANETLLIAFAPEAVAETQTNPKKVSDYASPVKRFLFNPTEIIVFALYIISFVVILVLFFMIFINIKLQYPKNIAYGIILIGLLLLAIFLNQNIIPKILIF